jgi:hypothetical protein
VLDLDVELTDDRRSVRDRVVCVPFGGQDRYYLTTLPRDVFTAHDVAELYRVRWEIGASSEGCIAQSVKVRPRPTDSRSRSVGGTVEREQDGEALRQGLERRFAKLQVAA